MPGADGLEVLRRARKHAPELPVILITAHATVPTAVAALREGAFDYVQKPFDNEELRALVKRALEVTRLARENRYLRAELRTRYSLDAVVAESPRVREALELARRAAASRSTVLVTGESGTGKELVARAVHYHSERVGGPLRGGELQGARHGRARVRALRPRARRLHRRRAREAGALRARGRRHALPRRDRRDRARLPDEAAARAAGAARATGRRQRGQARRRAHRRRHQPRPARRGRGGALPRGSLLPARRDPDPSAAAARAARGRAAARACTSSRAGTASSDAASPAGRRRSSAGSSRTPGRATCASSRTRSSAASCSRAASASASTICWSTRRARRRARGRRPTPPGGASLQEFLDAAATERIRRVLEQTGGKRVEAARRLGIDRATLYRLMRRYGITDRTDRR